MSDNNENIKNALAKLSKDLKISGVDEKILSHPEFALQMEELLYPLFKNSEEQEILKKLQVAIDDGYQGYRFLVNKQGDLTFVTDGRRLGGSIPKDFSCCFKIDDKNQLHVIKVAVHKEWFERYAVGMDVKEVFSNKNETIFDANGMLLQEKNVFLQNAPEIQETYQKTRNADGVTCTYIVADTLLVDKSVVKSREESLEIDFSSLPKEHSTAAVLMIPCKKYSKEPTSNVPINAKSVIHTIQSVEKMMAEHANEANTSFYQSIIDTYAIVPEPNTEEERAYLEKWMQEKKKQGISMRSFR